jgi:GT2 family glycosyltransferase
MKNKSSIQKPITPTLSQTPITPNISPDSNDIAHGCVDSIDSRGISGWYINKSITEPLLEVTTGEIVIGYCRPSLDRKDISDILGYSVNAGFLFQWSEVIQNTSTKFLGESADFIKDVKIKCVETGRELFKIISHENYSSKLNKWIAPQIYRQKFVNEISNGCRPTTSDRRSEISRLEPSCNFYLDVTCNKKISGKVLWPTIKGIIPPAIELSFYIDKTLSDTISLTPKIIESLEEVSRTFSWTLPDFLLDGTEREFEIIASALNYAPVKKTLSFGAGHFDSKIAYIGGGMVEGFITARTSVSPSEPCQLYVDSNLVSEIKVETYSANRNKINTFKKFLPDEYLDGLPHLVEIFSGSNRICSTHAIYEVKGHVDLLNGQCVTGWIYDITGTCPLELVVHVDDIALPTTVANMQRNDVGRDCGFYCDLSSATLGKSEFKLTIGIKNSEKLVLQTPKYYFRTDGLMEIVRNMGSQEKNEIEKIAIKKYLAPRLIQILRKEVGQGIVIDSAPPTVSNLVKIILPVYDGFDETLRCMLSLFKSKENNKTQFEVIIIDDHGPNPSISPMLKKVAERPDVTLITNPQNFGFVRSVNKALCLASGFDVVLLNADAVVNGNWLDRIKTAAYSQDNIASVTPFSNNATICSYPDPALENSMPTDLSLEEIDQLCATINPAAVVEIPSGVGFCMYMRAAAISEVGLLDADKFGKGYGEENDWCVRARDIGWKHLHACDTFVEHIGGVSFGKDKKSKLVEKNIVILEKIYPEYTPLIMDFIQLDPAKVYRNRITVDRIKTRTSNFDSKYLYVTHSFGGGIEVFCKDQEKNLNSDGIALIILESIANKKEIRLRYEDLSATYSTDRDFNELYKALDSLKLDRFHINSDIGYDSEIWNFPEKLNIPLDVTIHDYTPICPRVTLNTRTGIYCGEPVDEKICDRCVTNHGTYSYLESRFKSLNHSVADWRQFYNINLSKAENVYVPDDDVLARINKYFPELQATVRPHTDDRIIPKIDQPAIADNDQMRVAIIGAIGPHKGFELLRECISLAYHADLPLHFVIVGYTCNDEMLKGYNNVTITGRFEKETLDDILESQSCHAALFLTPGPETFSYTLTEALRAKLWPVVLPIGAQASRVRKLGFGTVLKDNATAYDVNNTLMLLGFR